MFLNLLPRKTVCFLVRVYQKTLSPDHGPLRYMHPHGYCKFYPSCSEYGYQSIQKHGVLKGGWYAIRRVVRCVPWNKGGMDPIPKEKTRQK